MNKCWNDFFTNDRLNQLEQIFKSIDGEFYPDKKDALRFLNVDLSKVKCVVLGMDPYPSYYIKNNIKKAVATGRSFEVDNLYDWNEKFRQTSLKNIVKTIYFNKNKKIVNWKIIKDEIYNGKFNIKSPKDWFDSLEKQGVLFLNVALTVKPGKPGSHLILWRDFMSDLIKYISEYDNIKWLSWGKEANEFLSDIINKNNIISASHPRCNKFIEENCFDEIKNINWLG